MKKVLFALAMGFALTGCGTVYDTYDGGYGYNDYSYGYGTDYIIINNGYSYGYNASVIDAITNRMIMEMALDQARATRLLELNRRYFFIFHSMPNYSFGYYTFAPGPPPPPPAPVGPGYYGGSNRPPYGGGYGNDRGYYGRGMGGYRSDYNVNMSDRDLEAAAREYTRSVRSIVGNESYNVFENKVRSNAKAANQKVNAVRVNPEMNNLRTSTNGATRSRVGNNTSTGTTAPSSNTNATRVRSNSSTSGTSNTNATRVRSNSSTGTNSNTGTTNTSTRVRSNNGSTNTNANSSGSSTRTRVRSNSSTGTTGNSSTTNTNTNTRSRTRTR